ncbi:hypothetical protein LXM25_05695 [Dyadobacter sp. LJ53]|uniref:hypothetical protein n=1 Tax=Dyadobacter chenwenxiniae TaxID=2906456 RepID=UPI001F1CF1FA|nr:hypothetical protein [Dyadobacter chenwenxiniae]MCF0049536.1 hypothetical protein [Dyadobacter chenwenxiniae]
MDKLEEQIMRSLELSEQDRFIVLGLSVHVGIGGSNDNLLREEGKRWFQEKLNKWQKILCANEKVSQLCASLDVNEIQLCLAIVDIIIDQCQMVPVAVVSAQIVKTGINNICNDLW